MKRRSDDGEVDSVGGAAAVGNVDRNIHFQIVDDALHIVGRILLQEVEGPKEVFHTAKEASDVAAVAYPWTPNVDEKRADAGEDFLLPSRFLHFFLQMAEAVPWRMQLSRWMLLPLSHRHRSLPWFLLPF